MLETSPENVKLMVESWKIHNKNQFWVKKSNNIDIFKLYCNIIY